MSAFFINTRRRGQQKAEENGSRKWRSEEKLENLETQKWRNKGASTCALCDSGVTGPLRAARLRRDKEGDAWSSYALRCSGVTSE